LKDAYLEKILRQYGRYYESGDLFYQRLWKQRLNQIGFRVILVEKLPYHEVWDIRVCGGLSAQSYLMLSKPIPKKHPQNDFLLHQLRLEVQHTSEDLGERIKSDCLNIIRTGAHFRITFIWPLGRPGRLLKKEKKAEAFTFVIQRWVRRNRN